jgi:hypothetical protein
MGKRKAAATSTIHDTQGLHGVSEESRRTIFNSACRSLDRPEQQVNSSQWKRLVGESCPDIYSPVSLDAVDGSKICFYIASVIKLLQCVVSSSANYAKEIQKCLDQNPSMCFEMILYNDEAQAGNLLSVDSDKKASLWYFSLREVGWRWCDVVWHPICLIQHNEIEQVVGGFSAVARLILRRILDEDLHLGFPISLPNNRTTLLKCDVKWMISDLDSVRAALSLKGSSAIRCCLFCKNAVKKHSNLEEIDDYFQDITSANLDGFHEQSDADIFELWDFLSEQQRNLRKGAMKKRNKLQDSIIQMLRGFQTALFGRLSCLGVSF